MTRYGFNVRTVLLSGLLGAGLLLGAACRPSESSKATSESPKTDTGDSTSATATPDSGDVTPSAGPQLPAFDGNPDDMTAEELVAAHRAAVGPLDDVRRGLNTVLIQYIQKGDPVSIVRSLLLDATGRGRLTYVLRPEILRGPPEGVSFDGEYLWRESARGRVLGPWATKAQLEQNLDPALAQAVLELGVTPLYAPLADELKVEVHKEAAWEGHNTLYGLLVGPENAPYMRVVLDRKTNLIKQIERLMDGRTVSRTELKDYVYHPALQFNMPRKIESYSGDKAEPTSVWELDWNRCQRMRSQQEDAYAGGKLPDLKTRLEQQGRFRVGAYTAIPITPQDIDAADLDGDGRPDVVVPGEGLVAVLFNDGKQPFAEWKALLERRERHGTAIFADVDNDDRPDLIVGSQRLLFGGRSNDTLYILRNLGQRNFGEPAPAKSPVEPTDMVGALLNDDLNTDLAVVNAKGSKLIVFAGPIYLQPGESFNEKINGRGRHIAAGDINGDGMPDLAVTNEANLLVFTRVGAAKSAPAYTKSVYEAGDAPFGLAVADFNGDGRADVAVGAGGNLNTAAAPEVTIMYSGKDGVLELGPTLLTGHGVTDLVAADFDEDGDVDLAGTTFEDHSIYVWSNDGKGGFGEPEIYLTDYGPIALKATDLDADGDDDLVVANMYGNSLTVLWNELKSPPADASAGDEQASDATEEKKPPKEFVFDPASGQWKPANETGDQATEQNPDADAGNDEPGDDE